MDFTQLVDNLSKDSQTTSGYTKGPVGGTNWQSNLGQSLAGLSQPAPQTQPQTSPIDPSVDLAQYGELNPNPYAGMNWGMAGQGGLYPHSTKDLGRHMGDVLPGGLGAPQADPMYQMFGDQAGPVFKTLNSVWQAPGNLGQKLGGNIGRFLITGNPFNLF